MDEWEIGNQSLGTLVRVRAIREAVHVAMTFHDVVS
jgi:hypothetical protein